MKLINVIIYSLNEILVYFIVYAPKDVIGNRIRKFYWRKRMKLTSKFFIGKGAILEPNSSYFDIGNNFTLGEWSVLNAGECKGVFIGNNVGIARGAFLRSANHKFDKVDTPYQEQGHDCKIIPYNNREYSIIIEDDVWIGANSIILSGAYVGKGSVLSAGCVISSKIPPYSIVVGNPARVIGNRKKRVNK